MLSHLPRRWNNLPIQVQAIRVQQGRVCGDSRRKTGTRKHLIEQDGVTVFIYTKTFRELPTNWRRCSALSPSKSIKWYSLNAGCTLSAFSGLPGMYSPVSLETWMPFRRKRRCRGTCLCNSVLSYVEYAFRTRAISSFILTPVANLIKPYTGRRNPSLYVGIPMYVHKSTVEKDDCGELTHSLIASRFWPLSRGASRRESRRHGR